MSQPSIRLHFNSHRVSLVNLGTPFSIPTQKTCIQVFPWEGFAWISKQSEAPTFLGLTNVRRRNSDNGACVSARKLTSKAQKVGITFFAGPCYLLERLDTI